MFTHEQMQSLNKLEFGVYNYIIANRDKIANMTIRELAEHTHVSPTVILRFCEKMGCRGYSEFKVKFKIYNLHSNEELENQNINYVLDFLKNCSNEEEQKRYDDASLLIADATRVIFLGTGASGIMAKYGAKHLNYMSKMSQYIDDPFFVPHSNDFNGEVVIALTVSGETENIIRQVRAFKETGSKIISITNSLTNTMANMADVALWYNFPMEKITQRNIPINITTQLPVIYILETLGRKVRKLVFEGKKI